MATHSNGGGQTMDNYDIWRDYGPANWDVPHRFVASYLYDVPFLKDSPQPILKYVVAGWQVSGVTTIQSGYARQRDVEHRPREYRHHRSYNVPTWLAAFPTELPAEQAGATDVARRQLINCFDASAFALPAQFTFGNMSRNVLRGPKFSSTDLSFMKNAAGWRAGAPADSRRDLQLLQPGQLQQPERVVRCGGVWHDHRRRVDAADSIGREVVVLIMAPVIPNPKRIKSFKTETAFETWMRQNHARESELWLRIYKKDSGAATVTNTEALDVALCWGWIDGIRKAYDERSFLQRYTPRRSKSVWSQINRDHVARLTRAGRMTPHGQRQVDAAKADGRWDAAYAPIRSSTIPDDLGAAIEASPRAKKKFATLGRVNLFALAYRTNKMKTPAGRTRKIEELVKMLERGETIVPERRR